VELEYHRATFDLLGIKPRVSAAAIRAIEERGRALGITLPDSLREWYSIGGAVRLLAEHSDGARPVPLKELGDPRDLGFGLLKLLDEGQGVAEWYACLDGSDDPPVDVISETFGDEDGPSEDEINPLADRPNWRRREAESFSAFIHRRVLTYGGDAATRAAVAAIKDPTGTVHHNVDLDDRGRIVRVWLAVGISGGAGRIPPREDIPAAVFGVLRAQAGLRALGVGDRIVGAEAWSRLRDHPRLESLQIEGRALDDASVGHLIAMPALRHLELHGTGLTEEGIVALLGGASLTSLKLRSDSVTGAGLARLADQTALVCLELVTFETLDDAGLASLAGLAGLKSLLLRGNRLTDEGLKSLSGLTALEHLDLYLVPITDAGLAHLGGLTRLECLNLGNTRVEGHGLRHLAGLTGLRHLTLNLTRVGDPALAHIGALTSLRSLDLTSTAVTDAGLGSLAPLQQLESLDLTNCPGVTDEGVGRLAPLRALSQLDLACVPGVTDAGIRRLEEAIPGLHCAGRH
jgi:hypothetical protein